MLLPLVLTAGLCGAPAFAAGTITASLGSSCRYLFGRFGGYVEDFVDEYRDLSDLDYVRAVTEGAKFKFRRNPERLLKPPHLQRLYPLRIIGELKGGHPRTFRPVGTGRMRMNSMVSATVIGMRHQREFEIHRRGGARRIGYMLAWTEAPSEAGDRDFVVRTRVIHTGPDNAVTVVAETRTPSLTFKFSDWAVPPF